MPSDRAFFVGAALLGLGLGLPAWALAKGQWCNTDYVEHQAELTLVSATANGRPITLPTDVSFKVVTDPISDKWIYAHVFSPRSESGKPVRVYHLQRKP